MDAQKDSEEKALLSAWFHIPLFILAYLLSPIIGIAISAIPYTELYSLYTGVLGEKSIPVGMVTVMGGIAFFALTGIFALAFVLALLKNSIRRFWENHHTVTLAIVTLAIVLIQINVHIKAYTYDWIQSATLYTAPFLVLPFLYFWPIFIIKTICSVPNFVTSTKNFTISTINKVPNLRNHINSSIPSPNIKIFDKDSYK